MNASVGRAPRTYCRDCRSGINWIRIDADNTYTATGYTNNTLNVTSFLVSAFKGDVAFRAFVRDAPDNTGYAYFYVRTSNGIPFN